MSLSARRAWIEMLQCLRVQARCCVALRKESVDRNVLILRLGGAVIGGRSPQGERG